MKINCFGSGPTKITNTLSCYEEGHDGFLDYELQIDRDCIIFALVDDNRAVKIELRPDGGLNVLLYPTDQEEPHHLVLTTIVQRL